MVALESILLQRRADQAINNSADVAISWDTQVRNTGPSSWWSAGAPTNIVMPYSGVYIMTAHLSWAATSTTGIRVFHLHAGSGAISSSNFEYNQAHTQVTANEDTRYTQLMQHVEVDTAGLTFQAVAWQSTGAAGSGSYNLVTPIGTIYPAQISFTYLG